jgi:hypothetical protein
VHDDESKLYPLPINNPASGCAAVPSEMKNENTLPGDHGGNTELFATGPPATTDADGDAANNAFGAGTDTDTTPTGRGRTAATDAGTPTPRPRTEAAAPAVTSEPPRRAPDDDPASTEPTRPARPTRAPLDTDESDPEPDPDPDNDDDDEPADSSACATPGTPANTTPTPRAPTPNHAYG